MEDNLLRFKKDQKYVVFDTETEGLNLFYSRPWQVAWKVFTQEKELETHNYLLKWPNLKVTEGAARVTGFKQEKVDKEGLPPIDVWDLFKDYLNNPEYLLCGHNVLGFDIYMLSVWQRNLNIEYNYNYLDRVYDTLALARAYYQEQNFNKDIPLLAWQFQMLNFRKRGMKTKLSDVANNLGIKLDQKRLHDADYDIYINKEVFKQLLYKLDI